MAECDRIAGRIGRIKHREYIYFKEGHLQDWNEVIKKAVSSGIKPSAFREFVDMQVEIAKRLAGK